MDTAAGVRPVCIITGANAGIGRAAAAQLAGRGYAVVMACRNAERAKTALEAVKAESGSDAVQVMPVDMSLQSSVRAFAELFQRTHARLDVLIHNAAAFDISQKSRALTPEGVESILATNHIGPVLLTELLIGPLEQARGRLITVSSKGLVMFPGLRFDADDPEFERRRFSVMKAYYQSKLAQVCWTFRLARTLRGRGITANAVRVTNVKIDVSRYSGLSKPALWAYRLKSTFSITPEQMAQTYTWLATNDEAAASTGQYFDEHYRIVKANRAAYDEAHVDAVIACTRRYLARAGVMQPQTL